MSVRTKGPRFYTTKRKARDFLNEIMSLLSDFGARSYHVFAQDDGSTAIGFVLHTEVGPRAFRLAPNVEGVRRRLDEGGWNSDNAEAVAWAQVRHLLEMQLEAVESGLIRTAEAFGGLCLTNGNRTVAEIIESDHAELVPGEHPLLPSA